jgi:signal transduction histidine kinase
MTQVNAHEQERLAALHEYRLLDAPADDELEAVVRVAAMVAGVSNATLNLIDENRQCQLTTTGFEGGDSTRRDSMCAIRFEAGQFVHVRDARLDPAYDQNPWVTGILAKVRFYASVPLVTPHGHALGTLCVFDSEPGELNDDQIARLKDLAGVILALFERRRQARINGELLREAEARQQLTDAVLETIDVAVVAADESGHLNLFNRAARDWHGLDADPSVDPGDFSGRYALYRSDGVTPLAQDEVPLLRALHGGDRIEGAEMVLKPAGRPAIHVVTSGRAMRASDGTPLGAVAAMTDVTADRAQRAALERAHADLADTIAELQRSNTELEQFAGVVSHDLAAPLAVVGGYLELLDDLYTAGDPQATKWVGAAGRAVGRMQPLFEALLTCAQAGNGPCKLERADLGEAAAQAVSDLCGAIEESGAAVVVAPGLPVVSGDPTLLRQLLQNLIGNAVKYRHPDRPVRVEVDARRDGDQWLVSVADNGRGIPAAYRRRVFEMFTRLDRTAGAGHGIGLSTCQRIVERHGGQIWADGRDGGTVISFTLPEA